MRAVLSCAGTGGHIYPAIAIADKIRRMEPDSDILFIGTKSGMENRLVPSSGYEVRGIDASGINRRNLLANFKTAKNLISGGREAVDILKAFAPDVVIGTGGYVTGTVVRKAAKLGIPCYIHEQNVVPGMANKLLEKYVDKVFISFFESEDHFKDKSKLLYTGNPIRKEFLVEDPKDCRAQLGIGEDEFVLLITGGSLGAEVPNLASLDLIREISASGVKAKVLFVSGKRYYEEIAAKVAEIPGAKDFVRVIDYADNMPVLMGASDLIISRAGAIALSEITAIGKPSVLIPSPNVTNNHQYWNAKAAADAGAALLIEEKQLTEGYGPFSSAVLKLMLERERLNKMSACASSIGRTDAVDIIWREISRRK